MGSANTKRQESKPEGVDEWLENGLGRDSEPGRRLSKVNRDPVSVALRRPGSRKFAIHAHCYECQGGNADPAPHWRIGNCEISRCPLWKFRPYQHHYQTKIPCVIDGNRELHGDSDKADTGVK